MSTKVDTSREAIKRAWDQGCGSVPGSELDSTRPEHKTAYSMHEIALALREELDAVNTALANAHGAKSAREVHKHPDPFKITDTSNMERIADGFDVEAELAILAGDSEERVASFRQDAEAVRATTKERDTAVESLLDAAAHLVGASSAYATFAKRHASQGKAETDALFGTRNKDFKKAAERAQAALKKLLPEE